MLGRMATTAPSGVPTVTAELDPAVEITLAETRVRKWQRLGGRDLWSSVCIGGAFVVAAGAILALLPAHRPALPWPIAVLATAYALASRVEFAVGSGFAIPTALVFVPMLFVLPLRLVPICVAA